MKRIEIFFDAACLVGFFVVAAIPLANPDLFWHLSAGRSILVDGALPHVESFSTTLYGTPWVNFEWLLQLIFSGVFSVGGWWGLLFLKALLFAMTGVVVWSISGLTGASKNLRRAALMGWTAVMLLHSELKPGQFSLILFCVQLWVLEAARVGELVERRPWVWGIGAFVFFAFWANLHPGFPMGFALIACWMLGREKPGWVCLAAALGSGALGTLATPYGIGVYAVLLQHFEWMGMLSNHILEWRPPQFGNPFQFPLWLTYGTVLFVCADGLRGKRLPIGHGLAAMVFGVWGLMHTRQGIFFAPVAVLVVLTSLPRWEFSEPRRRVLEAGWAAACLGFVLWLAIPDLQRARTFDARRLPVAAGNFIESNLNVFRKRRFFNEWGWGGYLGHRFYGNLRVFMDGRYLFHPILEQVYRARRTPLEWRGFLDKNGVSWAIVNNAPRPLSLTLRPKDGKDLNIKVEHFATFFPRYAWALVYQDPIARIFVRRGSFPKNWIAAYERQLVQRPK